MFFRRESNGRAKFRIRRYNNGPVLFVERKLKRASLVTKRRTEIPLEEVASRTGCRRGLVRTLVRAPALAPATETRLPDRVSPYGASGHVVHRPLRLTIDRHIVATSHQHRRFHVSFGRRDPAGPGSARIEVPRSRAAAVQATDREIQSRAPRDLQVPNGHGSPRIGRRFRPAEADSRQCLNS